MSVIADGQGSGALGGAAIGYKDIVDVVGLPREANSPLLKGYIADEDATVTTRLKNAGALCLGKTVTTQFATSDPSETRNPWNFKRSPGGSSSGSAAAVATGMVPAALGSQTGGSTLRPSAFCGVVGLKPTYGRIPRSGLITVSWNLDHVGVITRCAEDAARVLTAISGADGLDAQAPDVAVPDYAQASAPMKPKRACFWKEDLLPHASEEVAGRIEECVASLKAKGVDVQEARLPVDVDEMHAAHRIIMRVEAAAYHDKMFLENQDAYASQIRKNISTGLMTPAVHYVNALRFRARFIQRMERFSPETSTSSSCPPRWSVPPLPRNRPETPCSTSPSRKSGFRLSPFPWAGEMRICPSGFNWADAVSVRPLFSPPPAGVRRNWAGSLNFRISDKEIHAVFEAHPYGLVFIAKR